MSGNAFHPTALDAVNEALVTLGQDVTLTELSKTSETIQSRKAAYLYESARLKVLRDHNWSFARREEERIECDSTFAPSMRDGGKFNYSTPAPAKCARMEACYSFDGREAVWRLEGGDIRSDRPVVKIVYTADIADLNRWSADARRALVLRLAADLAKPITGRLNERQLQEQAYQDQIAQAKLADARESNVPYDAWGRNHYVEAMGGGRRRMP